MCLCPKWRSPVPAPQTTLAQPLGAPLLCAPRTGSGRRSSLGSRTRPWWQSEPLVPTLPLSFCSVGWEEIPTGLLSKHCPAPQKNMRSGVPVHLCPQSSRVSGSQDPALLRSPCAQAARGQTRSVSGPLSSATSSPAPRAVEHQQGAGRPALGAWTRPVPATCCRAPKGCPQAPPKSLFALKP